MRLCRHCSSEARVKQPPLGRRPEILSLEHFESHGPPRRTQACEAEPDSDHGKWSEAPSVEAQPSHLPFLEENVLLC